MFDRSTKPNIQCTVSVYQKCHFQSKLKCSFSKSFQICIFLQILAIILIIPTSWAEKSNSLCSSQFSAVTMSSCCSWSWSRQPGRRRLCHLFGRASLCGGQPTLGDPRLYVPVGLALSCKCGSKGGEHGFGKLRSSSTSSPWVNEEKLVDSLELEVQGAPTRD